MTNLVIAVDDKTESALRELSAQAGANMSELAARLLRRAVRATRPRPVYDREALKAAYAPFAEEDLALAEADAEHRALLLQQEDEA